MGRSSTSFNARFGHRGMSAGLHLHHSGNRACPSSSLQWVLATEVGSAVHLIQSLAGFEGLILDDSQVFSGPKQVQLNGFRMLRYKVLIAPGWFARMLAGIRGSDTISNTELGDCLPSQSAKPL
ncbi:hypothetical protein M752DRAFT_264402 [Aspergillus phoenicis ATCC 13157]|uniref:Uncharacterized protein n=1 Tax=Aspergillus phoenicis ATCC 13157 TaxID=1353007 RepID=A0A370PQP7_ASPPH|nr:hypothetical protein M752DRAFT_264402 [Aspergillus phoenicis ATCC 13157]